MKKTRVIAYTLLFTLLLLGGYGFFMIPMEKEFLRFQVEECETADTLGLISTYNKASVKLENGVLKLPEKKYVEHVNYCSYIWLDKDLSYLKDSLGLGEEVEEPYFDLLTKVKLTQHEIDSINLDPQRVMNAVLLGERAIIYANNSKNNRLFFKALGRFWLNTVSERLTALSVNNPSVKYDENYKILVDRCRQNKFDVDLNYTSSEKFINYLVDKKYAYIINRVWIGTSPFFKIFLILASIITAYAYYLFMRKFYLFIKTKLRS